MCPMDLLAVLLLLQVTATNSFSHDIENFSLRRAVQKKNTQLIDSYQLDSLHPLRRTKRTWVITTIDVTEEEKGPFPKYAGQLFNNRSFNTSVKYLISGPGVDESPEIGLFSIEDDENGHVYVHRTIDREKTPSFQIMELKSQALQKEGAAKSYYSNFTRIRFDIVHRETGQPLDRPLYFKIKVKDVNDNAPEFPEEEFSITIRENHSEDDPVFQVTALDKDEGGTANSQVSYSLSTQMPLLDGFAFDIDPTTGTIHLSGCLNYKTASTFKLLVKAYDQGTPQLSSTATVNVAIEDANNHSPVFTRDNYQLQISAGREHSAALWLQVEDEDSPYTPAWRAKYTIIKGNEKEQFTIETDPDTNEGILSVIKPLSYKDDSEKRLIISVANEEPFFSCENGIVMISSLEPMNTTVNIKVTELQNVPQFHPPILVVQKEDEMKPGRVFRKYLATYPDGGPNKIRYELSRDPAGWLSVDENSGVLTVVKEFDQESPYVNNSLYTIIVHAIGHDTPPQTGTGTILLYLSDIKEHMPTLVDPSLDVCDTKEMRPLIIKAKSPLVHSHSWPFTFELAEDSEDVKSTWKLGRNFVESVELLMLRSLPQGTYVVPFIIRDRRGLSTRQSQHIRLCFCPDGHACEDLPQGAVRFGGGAIAIILTAFLLLLVSSILLCQFHVPQSKSKAVVLPQEGEQTFINYNEESSKPLCHSGLYTIQKTVQVRQHDHIIQTVDKILNQKLYDQSALEPYWASYAPCIYAEEGELEKSNSFHSLSMGSDDLPIDFLNTLGPKFSALDEICQKRFSSFS